MREMGEAKGKTRSAIPVSFRAKKELVDVNNLKCSKDLLVATGDCP